MREIDRAADVVHVHRCDRSIMTFENIGESSFAVYVQKKDYLVSKFVFEDDRFAYTYMYNAMCKRVLHIISSTPDPPHFLHLIQR